MICNLKDIQKSCSIILSAVDTSGIGETTDLLELTCKAGFLYLCVTNKESYVKVKVCPSEEEFHATVNATTFLGIISKTTTDTITFNIEENCLILKANGVYKFPLVFENSSVLVLPEIILNNITTSFDIDSTLLKTIVKYNSKQLGIGVANTLAQKLYYVDEKGALTFTGGACINSFSLPKPVKLLFTTKMVSLFRLFESDKVKFSLAYDKGFDDSLQTKVEFVADNVEVKFILFCTDEMLNSVPVDAIRGLGSELYSYQIVVNKTDLLNAIDRLCVFNTDNNESDEASIVVTSDKFTLSYHDNSEEVCYKNRCEGLDETGYKTVMSLKNLYAVLSIVNDQFITINFGNEKCFVVRIPNIDYIVPEFR